MSHAMSPLCLLFVGFVLCASAGTTAARKLEKRSLSCSPVPADDRNLERTEQRILPPGKCLEQFECPVNKTEWLLAQDSEIENCKRPVSWKDANPDVPIQCYVAVMQPGGLMNVGQWAAGDQKGCEKWKYCNGPLKVGVRYGVKLRLHIKGGYLDTEPAFFTAGLHAP